jgi:hypothetical protein
MATLTTGYSWTSGETVTPAKLNSMVNSALLSFAAGEISRSLIAGQAINADKLDAASVTNTALAPSSISSQSIVDSLATADSFLIFDASANALRRVTFAEMLTQTSPVGSVIKTAYKEDATWLTLNHTTNFGVVTSDTAPVATDGVEIIFHSITPTSASNKVAVNIQIPAMASSSTASPEALVCVFRGTTPVSLHRTLLGNSLDDAEGRLNASFVDSPATTSAVTYSVRIARADQVTGTIYINGTASGRRGGGAYKAAITLQEIKG